MPAQEMNPYHPRRSIVSSAFALRHMILEEVKHRRQIIRDSSTAAGPARAADGSSEDETLILLARGLQVEKAGDHFEITVGDGHRLQLSSHEPALYWRGLEPADALAKLGKPGADSPTREDPVLQHNRDLVASIVDRLLEAAIPQLPVQVSGAVTD